jgi:hypothetical protein
MLALPRSAASWRAVLQGGRELDSVACARIVALTLTPWQMRSDASYAHSVGREMKKWSGAYPWLVPARPSLPLLMMLFVIPIRRGW